VEFYSDDGTYDAIRGKTGRDLVSFVGPLPQPDQTAKIDLLRTTLTQQTAEIDRLRTELEQSHQWRTAATDAHSQSETLRIEQATEIERLKAEWRSEFTAAQQLRSEVAQLEQLLDDARENLRVLREDRQAVESHCEGMKAAYLAVIKTFVEASR
jgi:outer membrane murein-binding lipoprotein Lpp